ncbi:MULTISPECIES: peptide ABC transporter substrate-binding protein [Bacillaceae]|uniref:peptide ABC transporter substrate-binding protein n=1 Tax=Bacillaceae TaxID=186817 RepID=UPI001BDE646A|nr:MULTISPECIES: peptide ABC transporter substrate-binding protein [Bacillaceae]MDX8363169.1 peptide ABC transporter substrate-binding protein [Cytobacillus sp. IB215316]
MVFAACGNSETTSETEEVAESNETTEESEEQTEEETEANETGLAENQVLRVNNNSEPSTLNPGLAEDTTSSAVLLQSFEGLTRVGKEGKPEMAMAEDYEMSDDGLTYTFKLRDGLKWSNGDALTAHDFEYAWKWVLQNPEANYAYILDYVKNAEAARNGEVDLSEVGVKALDDLTLEVQLENPTAYFLELTAFYTYFPVNSKVSEANADWALDAGPDYTSNGPFKLASWEHNDIIVLEKNENYWDADSVTLETIEIIMINDQNTELTMFDNDELDWAGDPTGSLPSEALPSLKEAGILNVKPIAGVYWYKFNTEEAPFNNKKIRKAFAYSIDRKAIVENITQGGEVPAFGIIPPSIFPEAAEGGYFKDADYETAKQLLEEGLAEEGYASVEDLPAIELSYNTNETHAKVAQAIQDMWKKNLGVEVELFNQEFAVHLDAMDAGNYQIARLGWLGDFNDAMNFLEIYKEVGGNNDTRWENDEYKKLLDDSNKETDPAKRKELLSKADELIMEEMPIAPIYYYTNAYVKKDNLKGVVVSGLGDVQYKWAYFEAK